MKLTALIFRFSDWPQYSSTTPASPKFPTKAREEDKRGTRRNLVYHNWLWKERSYSYSRPIAEGRREWWWSFLGSSTSFIISCPYRELATHRCRHYLQWCLLKLAYLRMACLYLLLQQYIAVSNSNLIAICCLFIYNLHRRLLSDAKLWKKKGKFGLIATRSGDPQCKSWGDELYTHNNENLYSRWSPSQPYMVTCWWKNSRPKTPNHSSTLALRPSRLLELVTDIRCDTQMCTLYSEIFPKLAATAIPAGGLVILSINHSGTLLHVINVWTAKIKYMLLGLNFIAKLIIIASALELAPHTTFMCSRYQYTLVTDPRR